MNINDFVPPSNRQVIGYFKNSPRIVLVCWRDDYRDSWFYMGSQFIPAALDRAPDYWMELPEPPCFTEPIVPISDDAVINIAEGKFVTVGELRKIYLEKQNETKR